MTDTILAFVITVLAIIGACGRFCVGKAIGEFLGSLVEKCIIDPYKIDKIVTVIVLIVALIIALIVFCVFAVTLPEQKELLQLTW